MKPWTLAPKPQGLLQGQAEAYLEKLHDMAENKLKYMQVRSHIPGCLHCPCRI